MGTHMIPLEQFEKMLITDEQMALIKKFEGYYGELTGIPLYQHRIINSVVRWRFNWRMMLDEGTITEDVHSEGLYILEQLVNTVNENNNNR